MQHCYFSNLKQNCNIMQHCRLCYCTSSIANLCHPISLVILVIWSIIIISCSTVDLQYIATSNSVNLCHLMQHCYLSNLRIVISCSTVDLATSHSDYLCYPIGSTVILVIPSRIVLSCSTVGLATSNSDYLCYPMQHCLFIHLKQNCNIMQHCRLSYLTQWLPLLSHAALFSVYLFISSRIVISCNTV